MNSKFVKIVKPYVPKKVKQLFKPKEPISVPEAPLDSAYQALREFYNNKQKHYIDILKELNIQDDAYSQWYKSGGFGYDAKYARQWLIDDSSLSDFRGTCLDAGSGDGFWSFLLSEWYNVTGIDPAAGGIELSQAIRKRLPKTIQRRTNFIVGDAFEIDNKFDVIFCGAPSFFNFPIHEDVTDNILDINRENEIKFYRKNYPQHEAEKYISTAPRLEQQTPFKFSVKECLERLLAKTRKLFVLRLWTCEDFYGQYCGNSYCHNPDEVLDWFSQYGDARVCIDSAGTNFIAEIRL